MGLQIATDYVFFSFIGIIHFRFTVNLGDGLGYNNDDDFMSNINSNGFYKF